MNLLLIILQVLIVKVNLKEEERVRTRVGGQTLARVATLINSHPRLTGPLIG